MDVICSRETTKRKISQRSPSDTAHRPTDYAAQILLMLRPRLLARPKESIIPIAPPPLCIRSTRFIAAFIPVEFSLLRSTTTYRRRWGPVRFKIGGRGGRSKKSRGVREEPACEGEEMEEEEGE